MKLKHNFSTKRLVLTLFCLLLSACGGDDFSDLEQKIAEIKAKPKGEIDPLSPPKVTEPFTFDLDAPRKDPFQPVEKETDPPQPDGKDTGIKPDPTRVKEDLESYALDTLKMVGTLKDSTLWGLVRAKNGTIYRVKVGNYMGLNDGEIVEILNDEIKLMEIVQEKSPDKDKIRWNKQPASLRLITTE
jgi:type IV pilus assembly protein PilP